MKVKSKKLIEATEYMIQNNISATQAAKMFQVDRHCIPVEQYQLYTIQKDEYCYYFNEKELEIVDYWIAHPEISFVDLKQKFHQPAKRETLKRWLDILDQPSERHYQIQYNRNAFFSIETEEDAYWLGFLLADGYINETKNCVQLKLGAKDRDHLVKFLQYLKYEDIENNIKTDIGGAYTRDNICYSVKVNGEQITNNLKQYKLFQRKSGQEVPYICSSVELEKAYIRGIIDGDGYLRTTEYGFGVVGSYQVLEYIKNFIDQHIVSLENVHITKHGIIYRLATGSKSKSMKILSYFYEDAKIYLERKNTIYQEKYRN